MKNMLTQFNIAVSKELNLHFFLWNCCAIDLSARTVMVSEYEEMLGEIWDDFSILVNELQPKLIEAKKENPNINNEISQSLIQIGNVPVEYEYLNKYYFAAEIYFSEIWKIALPILKKQYELLSKQSINADKLENIEHDLEIFFGHETQDKSITIALRYSPEIYQGGNRVNSSLVAVEKNPIESSDDVDNFWLLVLHEYVHAQFENEEVKNKLRNYVQGKEKTKLMSHHGPRSLFGELIVSSFASSGYLAEKYFNRNWDNKFAAEWQQIQNKEKKVNINDLNPLRNLARLRLKPLINKYIENNKSFDAVFLDNLYEIINEYEIAAL